MNTALLASLAQDLQLDFEHWSCEIPSSALRKYGSPHFDRKIVGEAITDLFRRQGTRLAQGTVSCSRDLLAVCNHAYPEAALVDPVADLELWQEWRLGIREFPYLGRYAPLGLFHQSGKTSSTSSVGVIGEILAGRLAEALIAPTVLVRVIRRWPDFILYSGDQSTSNRFAFVESKAVGPDSMPKRAVCGARIPETLFWELADQVVRQLNADPFVEVWGSFTYLREITPLEAAVTLVQFVASDEKKSGTRSTVPAPVLSGLAERCLGASLAEMDDNARIEFLSLSRKNQHRREVESTLIRTAVKHLDSIVHTELGHASEIPVQDMTVPFEQALSRLPRGESYLPGRRTRAARDVGETGGRLVPIGSAGAQRIFMAELPQVNQSSLRSDWTNDWKRASVPWDVQQGVTLWRAGGAVFAIGDPRIAGMPVAARQPKTATTAL